MSRNSLSDLEEGRVIGGRDKGDDGERGEGELGLDLDLDCERIFVGGEVGRVDMMGDGAWICIDMAKVAGARGGQPCGMRKAKIGGRSGECNSELW